MRSWICLLLVQSSCARHFKRPISKSQSLKLRNVLSIVKTPAKENGDLRWSSNLSEEGPDFRVLYQRKEEWIRQKTSRHQHRSQEEAKSLNLFVPLLWPVYWSPVLRLLQIFNKQLLFCTYFSTFFKEAPSDEGLFLKKLKSQAEFL